MTLYVGDVAPKAIPIVVNTGTVNCSTTTKVTVCGTRLENGTTFEWDLTGGAITAITATSVSAVRALAAGDLSVAGRYRTRITLYAGTTELFATDEDITITVLLKTVPDPT